MKAIKVHRYMLMQACTFFLFCCPEGSTSRGAEGCWEFSHTEECFCATSTQYGWIVSILPPPPPRSPSASPPYPRFTVVLRRAFLIGHKKYYLLTTVKSNYSVLVLERQHTPLPRLIRCAKRLILLCSF